MFAPSLKHSTSTSTSTPSSPPTPPPPSDLKGRGLSFWKTFVAGPHVISKAEDLERLFQICHAISRGEGLERSIKADGLTSHHAGKISLHPAVKMELENRQFVDRALRDLSAKIKSDAEDAQLFLLPLPKALGGN